MNVTNFVSLFITVFVFLSLYYIFPLRFNPFILLTPAIIRVVHVHESFLIFAQSLCTLTSPTAVILLSIYESISIFLLSSVCSLDFTYEWNSKENLERTEQEAIKHKMLPGSQNLTLF